MANDMNIHEASYTIGNIRAELEYIGEGYSGDYDPDDPQDEPLLRFYVSYNEDGDWFDFDDASYCTCLSARSPQEIVDKAAKYICETYCNEVESRGGIDIGPSRRLGEQLSYISEDDFIDPNKKRNKKNNTASR